MAFADKDVQLSRLEAFEGETLKRHSAQTTLGIAPNDAQMASEAVAEVRLDLFDNVSKHFYDGSYANETALLDALADEDDNDLIERLMALKFLELFFGDQSWDEGSNADKKASFYEAKYDREVGKVANALMANLDDPKLPNRIKFSR